MALEKCVLQTLSDPENYGNGGEGIVFGLVAVAVLVSACAKNVVPSTEQLRAYDQQVIDEQPADEGIPFRVVVSHDNIVKAISKSAL